MSEGVIQLLLPGVVILFAFIVLDNVIDLFETIIDFVMGRR